VLGVDPLYPGSDWTISPRTGPFEWVAIDDTPVPTGDCYTSGIQPAATAAGAVEYGRPEDIELIDQTLYVANTSEDRVIAIDLSKRTVATFVAAGLNVPVEDSGDEITGFDSPDNLANGPDGSLWIVEDNTPSDIWVAGKDGDHDQAADTVSLFASLTDSGRRERASTSGRILTPRW
jgi:uncharacterized protein